MACRAVRSCLVLARLQQHLVRRPNPRVGHALTIENGTLWLIALAVVVYMADTTIGSCWMMLRTETGKKVGAQ